MRSPIISLVVAVCMCWMLLSAHFYVSIEARKDHRTAAVPKSKSSKSSSKGVFGNSMLKGLMRDAKMAFCSPLEQVTLQITRPSNTAVPLGELDELASFVEIEGENPETLVSALAKLSRKFAEQNIYTQLKTTMSLHYVSQHVGKKIGQEWSKAIVSLMRETDEKTGGLFFDLEGIEEAKGQAESALELELAALEDIYVDYVMDFLKQKFPVSSKMAPNHLKTAESLLKLIESSDEVLDMAKKITGSSLVAQVVEFVESDRPMVGKQLLALYENESLSSDVDLLAEAEAVFTKLKLKFSKVSSQPAAARDKDSKPVNSASVATEKVAKETSILSKLKGDVEKSVRLSSQTASSLETTPPLSSSSSSAAAAAAASKETKATKEAEIVEENNEQDNEDDSARRKLPIIEEETAETPGKQVTERSAGARSPPSSTAEPEESTNKPKKIKKTKSKPKPKPKATSSSSSTTKSSNRKK